MLRIAIGLVVLTALAMLSPGVGPGPARAGEPAPGKINLQGTSTFGEDGKAIIAFAFPAGGGAAVGRACWLVDSDAFGASFTPLMEVPEDNPCGPATPEAILPPGAYNIAVGLYQPGEQAPQKTVNLAVDVDGDAYPTFDGVALSREPVGDADCDQQVDGEDVVAVLEFDAGLGATADCIQSANVGCQDALEPGDALAILSGLAGLPSALGGCPSLLQPPALRSPADGAVFDVSPRVTPLDWDVVPDAAAYVIQADIYQSCPPYDGWCAEAGWGIDTYHGITDTEYEMSFVARGTGRWRVAAVDGEGRIGPFSEWRTFEHLQ